MKNIWCVPVGAEQLLQFCLLLLKLGALLIHRLFLLLKLRALLIQVVDLFGVVCDIS